MAASPSVFHSKLPGRVKLISKDNTYSRITDLFYNTNNTNDKLPLVIPVMFRPPFSEVVNAPDNYLVYKPIRMAEIPFGLYVASRDMFNPNPTRYVVWGFGHKVNDPKNWVVLFKVHNSKLKNCYFESCRSFTQIVSSDPEVVKKYMPVLTI